MTTRTFYAVVQRTERWDKATPAPEQPGFAAHAAYMHGMEAEGFIGLAGLLQETGDVVFIFHAAEADEVRKRLSQDPWQQDGRVRLARVEEIHIRIGAPPKREPA
ncbi:MAG TPA: hypothetical protein VMC02_06805 [Steroidobacteraceae bacterium]|nr:hypothetical protein [Steroidobacteraceae bacterium]